MRFLLYNIRYGTGSGWQFHLPFPFSGYLKPTQNKFRELVEFITSVNPDIVGLLEVDSGSYRNGKECQATTIARQLEHYIVYESKYEADSFVSRLPLLNKQGNAFLTNQQIKTKKFHYFKKGVKRLMIELELEDINIFLVHLSLVHRHRHAQLNDISRKIKEVNKPVIVAGDFNALWGTHELEEFLSDTGLKSANNLGLPSHPSRLPKRELDFILYSPDIEINSFQMPQVKFSDHMPLICDFKVS